MRQVRTGDFKFSEEEKKIMNEVIDSNRVTEHKHTKKFEKKWAKAIGTKYSIAVNSGTSALIAGLHALKHLSGDKRRTKVITSPVTYVATSNAIRLSGLEPVYGDIDKNTFELLPSEIEKILKEQDPSEFLAILPVHLMGYPCKMDEINQIAKQNNLFSFEDAAQAHGTKYKGKVVGSYGDLSDFSFYIAHNIQVGELGAINTNNPDIKRLVKKIKSNGRSCACDICGRMEDNCPQINSYKGDEDFDPRFTHDILGFNFRTNEFATALAAHKIDELESANIKRRSNVIQLNEGLSQYSKQLQLPIYSEDVSYLGYPVIVKDGSRKKIRMALESKGVETRTLFGCIPLHQPSFADLKAEYKDKLPNAKHVGENGFYIGVHQYLEDKDLEHIVKSFKEVLK